MDFHPNDIIEDERIVKELKQKERDYQEALAIIVGNTMMLPEKRHLNVLYEKIKGGN